MGNEEALFFSRVLTELTLSFHIIYATIGVGIPLMIMIAQWVGIKKNDEHYILLARRWARGFVITVAVGVVTGTAIGLQLSLLWPNFMELAGNVIALPLFMETFAFFFEAIFLGIYLYTWDRFEDQRKHFLLLVPVALGAAASSIFITIVNSFMNAPQGFDVLNGELVNVSPLLAMFSPDLAALDIQPDGEPVALALPQAAMLPDMPYAALTDSALVVSSGQGAPARISRLLEADTAAAPPFLALAGDVGRYYETLAGGMAAPLPLGDLRQTTRELGRVGGRHRQTVLEVGTTGVCREADVPERLLRPLQPRGVPLAELDQRLGVLRRQTEQVKGPLHLGHLRGPGGPLLPGGEERREQQEQGEGPAHGRQSRGGPARL